MLPNYVVINDENISITKRKILRTIAEKVQFPLSCQDIKIVTELEQKYDQEKNCAGLAAPQIGYSKQIIVFAVEKNIPKTIWFNPSYTKIGKQKHSDYEGCFSVKSLAGTVPRYKKIQYIAFDINGTKIEGIAEGFLARVIQHEIDHLNGKLFIDYVDLNNLKHVNH